MHLRKFIAIFLILTFITACTPAVDIPTPPSPVPTSVDQAGEISPTAPAFPVAVQAAQKAIAEQLGVEPHKVEVLQYENIDWPDACLGIQNSEQICAQVITPGYRVILQIENQVYEFHTDGSGDQVVEMKSTEEEIQEIRLEWSQEYDEKCIQANFTLDGIQWGECEAEKADLVYSNQQRQKDFSRFTSLFSSFTSNTKAGKIKFLGKGVITATISQQRMLAEWAQLVLFEIQTGSVSPDPWRLLAYSVEGGIAGRCEEATVFLSGFAEVQSCAGTHPEKSGIVWLTDSQLQVIYNWAENLRNFEIEQTDLGTADALTTKVLFFGNGGTIATPIEQQNMTNMAEEFIYQVTLPADPDIIEAARQVLSDYFNLLSQGNYSEAASLYGGSYDTLRSNNPSISGDDFAGLFQAGCTLNGFVCNLQIRNEVSYALIAPDTYRFSIELQNPDGSLFILGPCCGASEEESSLASQFDFFVKTTESGYQVMTLPVYVP